MIDQERQSLFEGELRHYSVTLKVRQRNLIITAKDSETLRSFRKVINQQFIDSQDMTFKANFEYPEDLFIHLTEHFSEIVIEKGVLRFSYTIGKKKLVKNLEIELQDQEAERPAIGEQKIIKMKAEFAAQLRQRDNRINNYQLELREIVNQFRKYKKENQEKMEIMEDYIQKKEIHSKKLEDKLQELQEKLQKEAKSRKTLEKRLQREEKSSKGLMQRLEMHNDNTKNLSERLKTEERNIKKLEDRLQAEEKNSKLLEEKLQKIERIVSSQIVPISHHISNSHQKFYALTNSTANSAKLTRIGGGNSYYYYNFVNNVEVFPNQYTKYAVRITKATNSALLIGFCTEKGFGNINNFNNAESVYYQCGTNGCLYEGGSCKSLSGCGSSDGDLVECVTEWPKRIIWSKDGKLLAECTVPAIMKGRPVYFSIILVNQGDTIEVISME